MEKRKKERETPCGWDRKMSGCVPVRAVGLAGCNAGENQVSGRLDHAAHRAKQKKKLRVWKTVRSHYPNKAMGE
jgi:hypothetical protein